MEVKVSLLRLTDEQIDEIASICGAEQVDGIYYSAVNEGYPITKHTKLKEDLERVINNGVEG